MKFSHLFIAVSAFTASVSAQAGFLDNYSVATAQISSLDIFNGVTPELKLSGLEGSAVAYAKDRYDRTTGQMGTLFFVGDEGTGVIEVSRTGQTLSSMTFDWSNTSSNKHDTEALTYLGNGQLVVGEERLQDAYKFTYGASVTTGAAGNVDLGVVALGGSSAKAVSFGPTIGNIGIEGISYDPRNGGFVTVKQDDPAKLSIYNAAAVTFNNSGVDAVAAISFTGPNSNSSLFGLASLSDVQTLSPIDSLIGTSTADNILVLSLDSRKLIEINRAGTVISSLDLSTLLPHNGIEGLTVDQYGNIFMVAEQVQDGTQVGAVQSKLIMLSAPVPEADSYAMLIAGLGVLGFTLRRRKNS